MYVWLYKQEFGKNLEGICMKSLVELWKQYMRLYYHALATDEPNELQ